MSMSPNSSLTRRAFLSAAAGYAAAKPDLPNIVVILADDLGFGDLSCYNPDSRIHTSNLDKLAGQGMRFTDAHTPSAVCTPTRYGLLTGRYAWRTRLKQGVLDGFDPPLLERGRLTLASMLRKLGYATACVGKWHLGMQWTRLNGSPVPFRQSATGGFRDGFDVDFSRPVTGGPREAGFDWYFGISASLDMSPYCFLENDRPVETPDVKTSEDRSLFMNQVPGVRTAGFRLEDVLPVCTRKAVEFIERHAQNAKGKPFFLYMPLTAPHLPVVPNQQFRGRSRAGDYGDFVVEMDSTVGAVLDVLDRTRLSGNTIVLFTSDNGGLWHWWDFRETDDVALGRISERGKYLKSRGHQSNAYLRGTKADIWEGGHRVPFLVRWPGRIKPGTVSDDLVCLTDVLATVAEITSTPLAGDAAEDSFSALAVMTGKGGAAIDRAVVLHSLHGEFAIRQGEWKLALSRGSGGFSVPRQVTPKQDEPAGQLYNLREDPLEKRNVYLEQPDVVARLSRLLEQYQREGRSRPLRH